MFRAYLLNAEGRITWGDWIEAANENEALEKARTLCGDRAPRIEVWQGARKVGEGRCRP